MIGGISLTDWLLCCVCCLLFWIDLNKAKTALKIQRQSCQTIQILILNLLTIKTDLYLLPISEATESNFSVSDFSTSQDNNKIRGKVIMWSTTQIWATSMSTQIVSKCVWSERKISKIWTVEANCTWNELRRLEMLVDLALTLLLTPRPEEGITREVIKMRNKVTDTVINIVMDALLCWYTPPEMQQVDTEFRGCVLQNWTLFRPHFPSIYLRQSLFIQVQSPIVTFTLKWRIFQIWS